MAWIALEATLEPATCQQLTSLCCDAQCAIHNAQERKQSAADKRELQFQVDKLRKERKELECRLGGVDMARVQVREWLLVVSWLVFPPGASGPRC